MRYQNALLDYFYENSALSFEGIARTEENVKALKDWVIGLDALDADDLVVHWISGATMNAHYELTGDNAYPDELNILVVEPGTVNLMKVAIPRFKIRGRWFDDIVDNNKRRELEKD